MVCTPPKGTWLWKKMNEHPTLFSDHTRGDLENFIALLSLPHSYWTEVFREGELIGVIYFEGLHRIRDCEIHVMFFDSKLTDKVPVCKVLLRWAFATFGIHRATVRMPVLYRATIRFARAVGFSQEGRRREVYQIGNRWVDELTLGILASEVENGR